TNTDIYLYAILRVFQTLVGVFSAWLVNTYVCKYPKEVKMNLLGIDVGTTSIKAAVFNEDGKMLSQTTVDYTLKQEGNRVEFDPAAYWSLFQKAMGDVTAGLKVGAMSIDTQCETLILTDEAGQPVRDAIVWLDNRAQTQAKAIEAHFGTKKVYEVTGQPEITAAWPACKLLWVKENEPAVWAKTKKIFLLEDYLLFKLTGEFVTEKTLQSSSLYFDIRSGTWWQEMLDYVGVSPDMLPTLKDSGEPVGVYENIQVVTGAMDQAAGAIGAGVVRPGIISEMTGTTMVLFVPEETIPAYDPDSKIPCHYNYDGSYARILWTTTAGMSLKWFKNILCEDFDFKQLDELAASVPPGCDGLVMLPHLCGSTMPRYNPDAKGAFYGLTLQHTRGHFVRSILEAVACMLKSNLDYLAMPVEEIRLMGGGAKSPLWCQIKADMTGIRLLTLENSETACLGSAILAGVGAGVYPSVREAAEKIVKTETVYTPQGVDYSQVYAQYTKLDDTLNAYVKGEQSNV
ncbi:MAG: FGGY-family carbohydrate kinase, partial [Clostridia bacterium]